MFIFYDMIYLGEIMIITVDDVRKVLAMFDKEDIQYINFGYLGNKYGIINNNKNSLKVKVRKLDDRNDKSRK